MKGKEFLRKVEMLTLSIVLCLAISGIGEAQDKYPHMPINFIVGLPPGSTGDLMGRALCNAASKTLGQPIIVTNKPGAGQAMAMVSLKNSKPDGYNLGALMSGAFYGQHMRKVQYDCIKDFTFLIQFCEFQQGILVRSDSPWKTFNELMDYAKVNPGKLRFSISGIGTVHHLVLERLALKLGTKWACVPFDGDSAATTALLGGHVDAQCGSSAWVPNVDAGQLRLLAVCGGGEKRMVKYPDVPTLRELGYDITAPTFYAIGGPKGLTDHAVDILHKAFKKSMDDPDLIKMAAKFYMPLVYRSPQDFNTYLLDMDENVGDLVRRLGLRKE
jgi:tripartite-type tricarboxylate transporter receptor subunit TctC